MYCSNRSCRGRCSCRDFCTDSKNEDVDTKTIEAYRGSQISLNFKFPFTIVDKVFEIVYASDDALQNPEIETIDDFNVRVVWSGQSLAPLSLNKRHRFRVGLTFADGTQKNYNNLWVVIK